MQNKGVVQKMPLPREIFPISAVLVTLYHTGSQLVILLIACMLTGSFAPDLGTLVAAPMAFLIVILLGTGMGLMFSAINVMYRDWTRVVQIFTNMLPFTVPMMYPYTLVAKRFADFPVIEHFYLLNPIANAVLLMQRAFWITTVSPEDALDAKTEWGFRIDGSFPPHLWERGLIFIGFSIVFLVIAQLVFTRLDDKIPDRLM
jgi:ABC-2 type transport system permease protein